VPIRIKAFALHLLISAAIGVLSLLLIFMVWYPAPLYTALGVTHVFLMLLAIDVCLGPALTLLIYKEGKKSLKFDLAVIAALQLSALVYGLWSVAEGRPAWLVFNADRFDAVRVLDIDTRDIGNAPAAYQSAPLFGPKWVGAENPADVQERNNITFEATKGGPDLAQRPKLYKPLEDMASAVRLQAKPVDELKRFNKEGAVAAALSQYPEADGWLPLMASVKPMVVLVDRKAGQVVAIVDLNPWN